MLLCEQISLSGCGIWCTQRMPAPVDEDALIVRSSGKASSTCCPLRLHHILRMARPRLYQLQRCTRLTRSRVHHLYFWTHTRSSVLTHCAAITLTPALVLVDTLFATQNRCRWYVSVNKVVCPIHACSNEINNVRRCWRKASGVRSSTSRGIGCGLFSVW